MLHLLALSFAPDVDPYGCHKLSDCKSCAEKSVVVTYPCYWCEIDNACHDLGSVVSPCSPPSADDKCISLSSLSNCALKDISDCPSAPVAPTPTPVPVPVGPTPTPAIE